MASFKVIFKPSVERDLRRLPKAIVSRVIDRAESLAANPFPPQAKRLISTEGLYRLRVADYRIVYEVNPEAGVVVVHYIRHRAEVYRRIR
jgi:mRNA interferase RelE/StbE